VNAIALALVAGYVAGLLLNLADRWSGKAAVPGKRMFAAGKIPPRRRRAPVVELEHAVPECTGYWWPDGDLDAPTSYVCERCDRRYPATPGIAAAVRSENQAGAKLWELADAGRIKLAAERPWERAL